MLHVSNGRDLPFSSSPGKVELGSPKDLAWQQHEICALPNLFND